MSGDVHGDLRTRVASLLSRHDPTTTDRMEFLRAQFDAGLAWVHFPEGLGGLGLQRNLQAYVDGLLAEAGAPDNDPRGIGIGLGMAAPTILAFGTPEQQRRGGVVPAVQRARRRLRPGGARHPGGSRR
jgi:alkylation response protein AidB-like acyl-CoA dehydrogenase